MGAARREEDVAFPVGPRRAPLTSHRAQEARPHSWQAGLSPSCIATHVGPICRGRSTGVGKSRGLAAGTGLKHFHLRMWNGYPPK